MKTPESKLKIVAIVRDSDGKPKFDDINNIPDVIWQALEQSEREEIENVRNT